MNLEKKEMNSEKKEKIDFKVGPMKVIVESVEYAQKLFRNRIMWLTEKNGFTEDVYARILAMEYHLTKDVQRHFIIAASHPGMAKRRGFRKFLIDFANEEELHFSIAMKDLENMGRTPGECPIDVKLWWTFFDSIIYDRPFLRLGGTCILENLSAGARDLVSAQLKSAPFVNPKNSRFIVIHQHGDTIPHGDQILEAIEKARLEGQDMQDLIEGARISTLIYMRMFDWCITGNEMSALEALYVPEKR